MKKEDRRVRFTRKLLTQAMLELLKDQHITKITVTMLCDSADVSRGTFYSHYQDPLDFLQQIEFGVYQELEKHLSSQTVPQVRMKHLLDYAAKNKDMFEVMLGENGTRKFQEDMMSLAQNTSDGMMQRIEDARLYAYVQRYSVTSAISVLQLWLEDGMPESTEDMAALVLGLIHKGTEYAIAKER